MEFVHREIFFFFLFPKIILFGWGIELLKAKNLAGGGGGGGVDHGAPFTLACVPPTSPQVDESCEYPAASHPTL